MKTKNSQYRLKAIYTGKRLLADGHVLQRFEKPDGSEMWFRGICGVIIGATYECGSKNISRKPKRTEDERIDSPEWDAQDALVQARNARARAENNAKRKSSPALRNAIDALKPLMVGIGFFERKALIELLAEKAQQIVRKQK